MGFQDFPNPFLKILKSDDDRIIDLTLSSYPQKKNPVLNFNQPN